MRQDDGRRCAVVETVNSLVALRIPHLSVFANLLRREIAEKMGAKSDSREASFDLAEKSPIGLIRPPHLQLL